MSFRTSPARVAVAILVGVATAAMASDEAAEVFAATSPSVFSVLARTADGVSQGSGVVVDSGLLATNLHVVDKAMQVQVQQGQQAWEATVEATDSTHDLALLRAPGIDAAPVKFGASGAVRVGDTVYAIGSPRGLELSLSQGLVSALRPAGGANVIQTTAAISRGSSGGGLFDARGRLLGLTTAQVVEGQNLNFAVPVELLASLGVRVVPDESPGTPSAPEPAEMEAAPAEPASAPAVQQQAGPDPQKAASARRTMWIVTIVLALVLLLARPATRYLADALSSRTPVEEEESHSRTVDRLAPFRSTARAELAKPETRDAKLWADAVRQSQGSEVRALAAYVELRANVLYREELERKWNRAQAQARGNIATRQ